MRSALVGLLALLTGAPALAQGGCTSETLHVSGTPVTIGYCVSGAPHAAGTDELAVTVAETYTGPGGSISRTDDLHFMAGEGVSRVIESVDLARLGLTGTLHLTLTYAGGLVRIEGALLTPGAITVK